MTTTLAITKSYLILGMHLVPIQATKSGTFVLSASQSWKKGWNDSAVGLVATMNPAIPTKTIPVIKLYSMNFPIIQSILSLALTTLYFIMRMHFLRIQATSAAVGLVATMTAPI